MSQGQTVATIWKADRKRVVVILKRGNLFTFEEDGEQFDLDEPYWRPISGGGLYADAACAEAAARAEIAWLREQTG